MAAMKNCSSYRVLGRDFPSVPVSEADFRDLLSRHGFGSIGVTAVAAPDWAEHGFNEIILVSATRS